MVVVFGAALVTPGSAEEEDAGGAPGGGPVAIALSIAVVVGATDAEDAAAAGAG